MTTDATSGVLGRNWRRRRPQAMKWLRKIASTIGGIIAAIALFIGIVLEIPALVGAISNDPSAPGVVFLGMAYMFPFTVPLIGFPSMLGGIWFGRLMYKSLQPYSEWRAAHSQPRSVAKTD